MPAARRVLPVIALTIMLAVAGGGLLISGITSGANAVSKGNGKGSGNGVAHGRESASPTPTPTATTESDSGQVSPTPSVSDSAPTSGAIAVPASIDATGGKDVTSQLQSFISSVPDGSVIAFPAGATYRMDSTLELANRNGLTLDGNGARFTTAPTQDGQRAQLRIVGGGNWVIRDLTIRGSSTVGGTSNAFVDTLQWQHGIDMRGVAGADIARVSVTDVYGDCFYLGMGYGSSSGRWTSNVRIHDSKCLRNGRQGVAVTAARQVSVDHSYFSAISLMTFNIEPNGADFGAKEVTFSDNQIGTGPRQQLMGIVGGGTVDGVQLSRNVLTGKPFTVLIDSANGVRRSNVVIADNTSDTPLWINGGSAVVANYVDGLSVTGNHQELQGPNMNLVYVKNSCQVTVGGNTYPGGVKELAGYAGGC